RSGLVSGESIGLELKSRRGQCSRSQRAVREALLRAGEWCECRWRRGDELHDSDGGSANHKPARPNVQLPLSIASVDPAEPVSVKRRTNPALSPNPKPPPLGGGAFRRRRADGLSSFL